MDLLAVGSVRLSSVSPSLTPKQLEARGEVRTIINGREAWSSTVSHSSIGASINNLTHDDIELIANVTHGEIQVHPDGVSTMTVRGGAEAFQDAQALIDAIANFRSSTAATARLTPSMLQSIARQAQNNQKPVSEDLIANVMGYLNGIRTP